MSSKRVLFYNIFMRKQKYFSDSQMTRAKKIPKEISKIGVDTVVFIELFDSEIEGVLEELLFKLGFQYRTKRYGDEGNHNSGMVAFSKLPILSEDFLYYSEGTKTLYEKYGRKGALKFTLEIEPGNKVVIVGTHLHSLLFSYFDSYREAQALELTGWLREEKNSKIVLAGDFNQHFSHLSRLSKLFFDSGLKTIPNSGEINFTLDPYENPLVGTEVKWLSFAIKKFCIGRRMLLDYGFSKGVRSTFRVEKMEFLSDHFGIVVEIN